MPTMLRHQAGRQEARQPHSRQLLRLPQTRPSVLDVNLHAEPCLTECSLPDVLVVYLNNQPITLLAGSSLEYASLSQILYTLRHRYPRQRP